MSKIVTILGGPEDGKMFETQDYVHELKMAIPRHHKVTDYDIPPSAEMSYSAVSLPIRRTASGKWVAIWKEPRC